MFLHISADMVYCKSENNRIGRADSDAYHPSREKILGAAPELRSPYHTGPQGSGCSAATHDPATGGGKDEPFLLLLNGAKLIPLNLSWAILLANFMAALESFFTEGDNAPDREVEQADWERLAEEAVTATRSVYPRTKPEQLREDLALLMESLIAIARGQEPPVEVGTLSLGTMPPICRRPTVWT